MCANHRANDGEHVVRTFPEISRISDEEMRQAVIKVYVRMMGLAGLDDLDAIPFTTTYGTEVPYPVHVRAVTNMAISMAEVLMGTGPRVDMDVLIAGALLHDVGKLLEYSEGTGLYTGSLLKHTFTGMAIAQDIGLPAEVLHCIIYHSYEGDGRRKTVESIVVHHCDLIHFEGNRAKASRP